MTRESQLNTIIKNSFNLQSYNSRLFKIPDPKAGTGIQNPFDIIGIIFGTPTYIESKLIKKEYEAFSLKRVEEHQYENLLWYKNKSNEKTYSLIIVGYYVPRKVKEIFIFDSSFVFSEYQKGVKSFNKKQILKWKENQLFLPINYKDIDEKRVEVIDNIDLLESKIIRSY